MHNYDYCLCVDWLLSNKVLYIQFTVKKVYICDQSIHQSLTSSFSQSFSLRGSSLGPVSVRTNVFSSVSIKTSSSSQNLFSYLERATLLCPAFFKLVEIMMNVVACGLPIYWIMDRYTQMLTSDVKKIVTFKC